MPLEQQVCSLELSRKLKELGVKQESLYYWQVHPEKEPILADMFGTSAFTVAELGEMLEINQYRMEIDKYKGVYLCRMVDVSKKEAIWETKEKNEANARASMLIYLLENNLITL